MDNLNATTIKTTYTVGIDFGTLSGRALLVRVSDGLEIGYEEYAYPHGVMDKQLPSGTPLGTGWALHHPGDYMEVLSHAVPRLLAKYHIAKEDVIAVGIDSTSCTPMPVDKDGVPLCIKNTWQNNPHAYAKLWKHHAGQYCADKIEAQAKLENAKWLDTYGGKLSSEFFFPKLLQIYLEAPELLESTDYFMEAGDWIVWQMVGGKIPSRSATMAGYKACYTPEDGFPQDAFWEAIAPGFSKTVNRLMQGKMISVGDTAGYLTEESADNMGLCPGIPVATALIDAQAAIPAIRMVEDGALLMVMGTSNCQMLLSKTGKTPKGIFGVVYGGFVPGYWSYEAGQASGGDQFSWFVQNMLPASYTEQAKEKGMSPLSYVADLAQTLKPGDCGLLALDWWNGNRSPLNDAHLSGMLLGMTMTTKPEEIYRALLEATAFGTRAVIDNYQNGGVSVYKIYLTGGMSQSPFVCQLFADVLGVPLYLTDAKNGPALGAAIYGASIVGKKHGGYDCIAQAIDHMAKPIAKTIVPNLQNHERYNGLYREYQTLTDYFGKGQNDVMKRLMQGKNP